MLEKHGPDVYFNFSGQDGAVSVFSVDFFFLFLLCFFPCIISVTCKTLEVVLPFESPTKDFHLTKVEEVVSKTEFEQ